MRSKIDAVGRIVIPKPLRDELGLAPGSEVDVTAYGGGLHVAVGGRTARLVEEDGRLVATSDHVLTDDELYRAIDAGRR